MSIWLALVLPAAADAAALLDRVCTPFTAAGGSLEAAQAAVRALKLRPGEPGSHDFVTRTGERVRMTYSPAARDCQVRMRGNRIAEFAQRLAKLAAARGLVRDPQIAAMQWNGAAGFVEIAIGEEDGATFTYIALEGR